MQQARPKASSPSRSPRAQGLALQQRAEAVPWRCHRSLIADALLVRGLRVEHIMSASTRQLHALTPVAKVQGRCVTYPAGDSHQ